MNPETALTGIAKILDGARPASGGLYILHIQDKKLLLIKQAHCKHLDAVLANLTSRDINQGPTTPMWELIRNRFARFHKRGLI